MELVVFCASNFKENEGRKSSSGLACCMLLRWWWRVGLGRGVRREMPSDADVVLRLRDVVCAARTCCVTSRGKHLERRCSTAGVCQGRPENIHVLHHTIDRLFIDVATVVCWFLFIFCSLIFLKHTWFELFTLSATASSSLSYIDVAYCYRWNSVICLSRLWAMQKWLNRSRCHSGYGLEWAQGTTY